MDAATVDRIKDLAVQAADPLRRVVKVPGDAPHVYHLVQNDGTLVRKETEAPRERSVSLSIPSLCDWVKASAEDNFIEVWYSRAGVVAIDHDLGRRTTLVLNPSAPLAVLQSIAGQQDGRDYDQGTLWRLLRTVFRDCTPGHANLRDQVGRVDVKKAQEASGTVERKGVSVSRKLLAEAAGADQLPEVLTFEVPVFGEASAPVKASVRAAFDFDAQAERFRVCVLPGEIDRAFTAGETWLFNRIVQEFGERAIGGVPVFHGRPE